LLSLLLYFFFIRKRSWWQFRHRQRHRLHLKFSGVVCGINWNVRRRRRRSRWKGIQTVITFQCVV
jgi:hypothetical protein